MSLDVSEIDFFSNPSGYLQPPVILIDPFMATNPTKKGPVTAGGRMSKFQSLRFASLAGVRAYSALKGMIAGAQAHHLIEQRFAKLFPELGSVSGWPAIVLTKTEHFKFTVKWRLEIGLKNWNSTITTANATREEVLQAARRIYKDYPEILKFLPLK